MARLLLPLVCCFVVSVGLAPGAHAATLEASSRSERGPAARGAEPRARSIDPGLFQEVSTGIAHITTFRCSGRALGQGSGFLVGSSVVMTARHVLEGACRVRVKVAGEQFTGVRWVSWRTGRSRGLIEDLATLKLNRPADGHVFRIRTGARLPAGANLAMIGYPLGNRISLNQGRIFSRLRVRGVPVIAVRMLGAQGASGSPFLDGQGKVVGILQRGYGSRDLLGQHTAGIVAGIEVSLWWGARARLDLCRAYPNGGIAGCPDRQPPTPPAPPPPVLPPLVLADCWVTASTSFDPLQKNFVLPAARQALYLVTQFNRVANSTDGGDLRVVLRKPDGTVHSEGTASNPLAGFLAYRFSVTLGGPGDSAPMAGQWQLEYTLNSRPACTSRVQLEAHPSPLSVTSSETVFDPYSKFSLTASWTLHQEVQAGTTMQLRLVTPDGKVADTRQVFAGYTSSGTQSLYLPFCSRYSTVDTCQYGTYRVEALVGGNVVSSVSLTGRKP